MKYYNPNKLFLAKIGNVSAYKGDFSKYFNDEGFSIFTKSELSNHEYIDIFSNIEYKNFHSGYCSNGDKAVNSPQNLVIFLQKCYKDAKKSDSLEKFLNKFISSERVSELELKELLLLFNGQTTLKKETKSNIKIYSDLYKKKYKLQPCFERGKELSQLICALPEKNTTPILIGEHGTGKTTIVEGLIYRIQKRYVPDFLYKQKIIELDIANLIGTSNKEEQLINLISYCIKNNIILFIDDIDKLVELELYNIVKESVKRKNLKIISSTTIDNYNKYFWDDDFTKILVDEPNDKELESIIRNVITNYCITNKIYGTENLDDMINGLIELTNIKNRKIDTNNKIEEDKSYNPYLVIQLIDRMFAHAIANNQKNLRIDDIKYAINSCEKIKELAKSTFINDIENLYIEEKTKRKTI